jgi:hypothetical protein
LKSLAIQSIDELARISKLIAASGYFGCNAEQAAIKIMAGHELRLGPLQAMMNVHVIAGESGGYRICLSAGLVGALIKKSGRYTYEVTHSDEESCAIDFFDLQTAMLVSQGQPVQNRKKIGSAEFSIKEAERANLLKTRAGKIKRNWAQYPGDMLFARALTRGARRFCPDVFGGPIYTAEEITGDEAGVPDLKEVKPEAPQLGEDERGQDPIRDELLGDIVEMASGARPRWVTNEIRNDPIGGSSYFGEGVTWADGLPDEPEGKAVRQKFHIWASEAGRNYDDIRDWPLDAIKARGIINLNRHLREGAKDADE